VTYDSRTMRPPCPRTLITRPLMVIPRREYLPALDEHGAESEAHRALLGGLDAALKILVGLVVHLRHLGRVSGDCRLGGRVGCLRCS
jgi:hypothetical protein